MRASVKTAGDRRRSDHGGRHQVGARAGALSARKLRLVVEAQRSPGGTRSPLTPTHIEQPDSAHSRPASRKIASSPSSSACRFTADEPGETRPGTLLLAAGKHRGGGAQILDAGVGAGADEDAVDGDIGQSSGRA